MSAPSREPEFRIDNPSALIRARIREKRIFEARFLCRQLGADLGTMEKSALEGELARIMAQVDKLRKQAVVHATAGKLRLAAKVYREIERIAIDVPDLATERRHLDAAEEVLARVAKRKPPRGGSTAPIASPESDDMGPVSASPPLRPLTTPRRFIRPSRRQLTILALVIGLLALAALVNHTLRRAPTPAPGALEQPASRIVIRPVVSSSPPPPSPGHEASPNEEASSEPPPATGGALSIGELQVQPSVRE